MSGPSSSTRTWTGSRSATRSRWTRTTGTVFTQFLFSYKINPQTVLFLGYSDNSLGMQGIDITRTDRTFFLKIGYAWTQ